MAWRIFKYIQHLFYRKHRKGHGIHSPYLFEFINGVLFNGNKTEVPSAVLRAHRDLQKQKGIIPPAEGEIPHGAGSKVDSKAQRSIHSFVRRSSVSQTQGGLLFRIAHWLNPDLILELGTGLGVSALYLASGVTGSDDRETDLVRVQTIEGDPARAKFSVQLFKLLGLNGIKVHCGEVDEKVKELASQLPDRFLAFLDANHKYDPTLRYLRLIIDEAGEEAVIVMDDIYWSRGMFRAWEEVITWPEVRISIDLFHMGILMLRNDLHKTHLKIKI